MRILKSKSLLIELKEKIENQIDELKNIFKNFKY